MAQVPEISREHRDGSGTPRRAVCADLDALIALEASSFASDHFRPRQWRYLLARPSAEVWVEEGVDTVAASAASPSSVRAAMVILFRRGARLARIYSLATAEPWRGQGLAGRLLALAERRARARGCDRLGLEVREDNCGALRLYEHHGFEVRRRLLAYYADGSHGLRLEKKLSAD
ncbi:MAG: N-acetyltransferase [Halieaceae bacterium]|jgi:ribosomal protein S18 acetylase RimI-like enzyme|nr:N-acetyltransferase [Halieaceae bacterium]